MNTMTTTRRTVQHGDNEPRVARNTIPHNIALLKLRGYTVTGDVRVDEGTRFVTMLRVYDDCTHHVVKLAEWQDQPADPREN